MKRIISLLIISMSILFSGCYSGYKLTKTPTESKSISRSFSKVDDKSPVLFVSGVTVKGDNLAEGFDKRLLGKLNETGLFKEVIYGVYARKPSPPFLDARLDVEESADNHSTGNGVKGFFIGFTFFLLTPALPLTMDFSQDFSLEVTWPNGQRRNYTAACAGEAYGTLTQAAEAFKKMPGEVTDVCLNSVINQMSADYMRMADTSLR